MPSWHIIFLIVACAFFLLGALQWPKTIPLNLQSAGLFFLTLAFAIGAK